MENGYDYVEFRKWYPFDGELPFGYKYDERYGKITGIEITRLISYLLEKGFYVSFHIYEMKENEKVLGIYVDTKMFKQR